MSRARWEIALYEWATEVMGWIDSGLPRAIQVKQALPARIYRATFHPPNYGLVFANLAQPPVAADTSAILIGALRWGQCQLQFPSGGNLVAAFAPGPAPSAATTTFTLSGTVGVDLPLGGTVLPVLPAVTVEVETAAEPTAEDYTGGIATRLAAAINALAETDNPWLPYAEARGGDVILTGEGVAYTLTLEIEAVEDDPAPEDPPAGSFIERPAVAARPPPVIFSNEPGPRPKLPYVSLLVMQTTPLGLPESELTDTVADAPPWGDDGAYYERNYWRRHQGTVSVQTYGPGHAELMQMLQASLPLNRIAELNQANGITVSPVASAVDVPVFLGTVPEGRTRSDFGFSFVAMIRTADAAVETVILEPQA